MHVSELLVFSALGFSTAPGRGRPAGAGSSRSTSAAAAGRPGVPVSHRPSPLRYAEPNLAPLENSVLILPGTAV